MREKTPWPTAQDRPSHSLPPSLVEYSEAEVDLIRSARKIFYPTPRFQKVFNALGKATFPSPLTRLLLRSAVHQEIFLQYHDIPRPRSRIFYGKDRESIPDWFKPPFLVFGGRGGAGTRPRTVRETGEPFSLVTVGNPLVVRELPEFERTAACCTIRGECVAVSALRDGTPHGEGWIETRRETIDRAAIDLSEKISALGGLDEIAVHLGFDGRAWLALGFLPPPPAWQSEEGKVRRFDFICRLIGTGRI